MEQSDVVLLAPTHSKKRQVEAISTMVSSDPIVGPPKATMGCLKKNMMIVDAKSSG